MNEQIKPKEREEGYSGAESVFALELQLQSRNVERQKQIGSYFADFYFKDNNLVLEIDGREYHSTIEDREKDRVRDTFMNDLGYCVVRVTASMVNNNPSGIAQAIKYLSGSRTYFINSQQDIIDIFARELTKEDEQT